MTNLVGILTLMPTIKKLYHKKDQVKDQLKPGLRRFLLAWGDNARKIQGRTEKA